MISIIVPIYKAEQYIHRCIDSILAQSYTDFELLLIDDGSPDNCGAICDAYAAKDSRVCVFHKENGGVSSARNLGLDKAQGEWITFIDADDYLHPQFLYTLYTNNHVDLVVSSFQMIGTTEYWDNILTDQHYNSQQLQEDIVKLSVTINLRTPWGKLFRHDIITRNNLLFNERMHFSEDWLFVLNYLMYTHSLVTVSNPYYYYERGNVVGLSQNARSIEESFYGMDIFNETIQHMSLVYHQELQYTYLTAIKSFLERQIAYLYGNKSDGFIVKVKQIRRMCRNSHIKKLCNDTTLMQKSKRKKLFDFLLLHKAACLLLLYIYLLKGRI